MASVWDGTLAAVIGGVSGALAGIGATTWTNKTNRTATRLEKRIDDIESATLLLRVEALAYWASPAGPDDSVAALKVIGLWEALVSRVDMLTGLENQVGDLFQVNNHVDALYELITGSDFQAKERQADSDKVARIRTECTALCTDLHASRRMVNRWRHFWKRRKAN